jgi:superfamily II DNA or RNA helicase
VELCVIWHKIKYFKKGAEPPAGVTIYRVPFGKMTYKEFLASKRFVLESSGFDIDKTELNPMLYEFQKDIVRWALKKGKACIFADCGLGKTPMQLSWAYQVHKHTGGKILILAPLAVAEQTRREAEKFGYDAKVVEEQSECIDGINITNYEKLDRFVANEFIGVVLDESSILKSYSGKVRTAIIQNFHDTTYKLACTATPAPNDYMELSNHSEFCGVMTRAEMLSMFFVHDGGQTSKWRLKGHAVDVFWQWLATFSVFIDNPVNIGYKVAGYDLPQLNIQEIIVDGNEPIKETLTLTERRQARKDSLTLRCEKAAEIANNSDEQWLIWCDLNDESAKLHEVINDSVEVKGSDKPEHKSNSMIGFSEGKIKCLVTKPSIAGFGMNWQNCHNMIFTGLSDSYEQFYQAVRRCYRFGQKKPVNVYIIISAKEGCVKENIERKQADFLKMQREMTELTKKITKKELKSTCRISTPYEPHVEMKLPEWEEFTK